ncbi:MAG: hypothetical protein ACRDN0_13675, partial [Trebonia sp.]
GEGGGGLGSILAEAYRSRLSPQLAHLPAAAANTAGQSVSATQAVAAQLGHAGQFLLTPASVSFVDAMRITTIIAAIISVLGGLVVLRWMPGKPRPTMDAIEEEVAAAIAAAEAEADAKAEAEARTIAAAGQELAER